MSSTWRMGDIIQYINQYRKFECLWNTRHEGYKRDDVKKNAWQQLSAITGRDVVQLKKKIKHLRTTYVVEKKKVDKRKKSTDPADRDYQPHLFYYNQFRFLDPVIVLRSKSNDEMDNEVAGMEDAADSSRSDSIYFEEVTLQSEEKDRSPSPQLQTLKQERFDSPSPSPCSRSCKRRAVERPPDEDKFDKTVEPIMDFGKGDDDNVYIPFSQSITAQMQQLTPIEAAEAMQEIQAVLTKKLVQSMQPRGTEMMQVQATTSRQAVHNQNTENDDEFELYTKSWASELRRMSPVQRIYAKREIADVICQGQLSLLNANVPRKSRFQNGNHNESD